MGSRPAQCHRIPCAPAQKTLRGSGPDRRGHQIPPFSVAAGRTPHRLGCIRGIGHAESVLRSEEHTSELQSRLHLVCRLLLEKKKNRKTPTTPTCRSEPAR